MQDTLQHLVADTIHRADSNKFLYVLNQIDNAAPRGQPRRGVRGVAIGPSPRRG